MWVDLLHMLFHKVIIFEIFISSYKKIKMKNISPYGIQINEYMWQKYVKCFKIETNAFPYLKVFEIKQKAQVEVIKHEDKN